MDGETQYCKNINASQINLLSLHNPSQNHCYELNVSYLSKLVCWNPNPSVIALGGEVFGRWLGHEGRAFTKGFSVLIRNSQKEPLRLLLC